jgi:hypothetical protein
MAVSVVGWTWVVAGGLMAASGAVVAVLAAFLVGSMVV